MSDLPPTDLHEADGDLPDVAAAELALGLLEGDERAAALRRVLAEPGFARAVERWRGQLAQMFDLWPGIEAPDVFDRVERSLDPAQPVRAIPFVAPIARKPSRWWPGIAAVSSVAAAALLVVLVTRPLSVPQSPAGRPSPAPTVAVAAPTPLLVASIDPSVKGMPVTAVYDTTAGAIRLTEESLAGADRSAELWIIPAGDKPHSLGLLRARGVTALTLSAENRARIAAGATLAVSLEPIGGSPTGQPTGPVVATGALSTV